VKTKASNRTYWYSQISGWTLYSSLLGAFNYWKNDLESSVALSFFFIVLLLGISLSHLYRFLIVRSGWLNLKLTQIIPRLLGGSILFGVLFSLIFTNFIQVAFTQVETLLSADFSGALTFFFAWTVVFVIWSMAYLAYHYLSNYEREEIKNLRLQSSQNEVELASLKAQLNPHFIFNAMNSIRALIDEDPVIAKTAITKLSNIMRNSLLADKRNLITLAEELSLVKDHLSLEKIRYEERLEVELSISEASLDVRIPPLVIQTLVENAIKHGIAKLQRGGRIDISTRVASNRLEVSVVNTGRLITHSEGTQIGLDNLRRRLDIIYGKHASFDLSNQEPGAVRATINLPISNHA
jgi:two-component system LytT family sensor kinase